MKTMLRAATAVAMVLAMLSCSKNDPTGPREMQEWILSSVDGDALPTAVVDNPAMRTVIRGDTLTLYEDGTAIRRREEDRYIPATSTTPQRARILELLTWTFDGDLLRANYVCPPDALVSCIAGPHLEGTILYQELTLSQDLGRRVPATFTRRLRF